jgi:hypothetical protein
MTQYIAVMASKEIIQVRLPEAEKKLLDDYCQD